MQAVHDALNSGDLPNGVIATIGNYDGLHRGQQEVLRYVTQRAEASGMPSVVITFDPHPLTILRPESAPTCLTTRAQKEELLAEAGVDWALSVHFTREVSMTPARDFVAEFLHRKLGVRELYIGSDFTFGHNREGNIGLLQEMGEELGFVARSVDEVRFGGERVSSTRIRELLMSGDAEEASRLLGRPYSMSGIVVRGDRMGQRLGWPTINLSSDNELVPLNGVYATKVRFPNLPAEFSSVTNIGTRPTVYENYERVVESHILDFRNDVYGETVVLSFYRRLREEKLFESMMDLSAQIRRDVETTREYFFQLEMGAQAGE